MRRQRKNPEIDLRLINRQWTGPLMALLLIGFFLSSTLPATRVNFGADEMMNIYKSWFPGLWRVAWANVRFWKTFPRPMGSLYYVSLFDLFGLNPAPYTVVRIAILLLNALLFYWLAARITRSRCMAALAAIPIAYHAGMGHIVYDGSFIYDVLCGGFYFAALLYYLHCRARYGALELRQTLLFLALFICALNSKEMAVSLPVIVFACEGLYFTIRKRTAEEIRSRLESHGLPVLAAIAIDIVYLVGQTRGPGALTEMTAYRPVFTWARFSDSSVHFLNTIFYTQVFNMELVILAWLALLYVALRNRDRRLLLLWVWVIVTPLPIDFIADRGGPCLYIVAAGWAMALSILVAALARCIAQEPIFARLPSHTVVTLLLALWICLYMWETTVLRLEAEPGYLAAHTETRRLIEQFQSLTVQPRHGSRVALLNNPFPEFYDTQMVAVLHWKDRSISVSLQSHEHFTERQLSEMDYVFDFQDGQIKQIGGR